VEAFGAGGVCADPVFGGNFKEINAVGDLLFQRDQMIAPETQASPT
jgi:hypothetical protein